MLFGADGNFEVRVSGANFTMAGSSRVDLALLGRLAGDFSVTIDTAGSDAGMFGFLRLGGGARLPLPGARFEVEGFLSLEFNTTGQARTLTNARPGFVDDFIVLSANGVATYNQTTILPANTVQVFVAGSLQLKQGNPITDAFRLRGGLSLFLSTPTACG